MWCPGCVSWFPKHVTFRCHPRWSIQYCPRDFSSPSGMIVRSNSKTFRVKRCRWNRSGAGVLGLCILFFRSTAVFNLLLSFTAVPSVQCISDLGMETRGGCPFVPPEPPLSRVVLFRCFALACSTRKIRAVDAVCRTLFDGVPPQHCCLLCVLSMSWLRVCGCVAPDLISMSAGRAGMVVPA